MPLVTRKLSFVLMSWLSRVKCECLVYKSRNFTQTANSWCKVNSDEQSDVFNATDGDTDEDYSKLTQWAHLLPNAGHHVFLIQPFIKWGERKIRNTTPELMIEEAAALVDSLPNWRCVDSMKISLTSFDKKEFFGTGNLDELEKKIRRNPKVTAAFVSVDMLRISQKRELQQRFGVPVFDRYSIVLQIFKERATTSEAKIQVALAEIPYLRSLLADLQEGARGGGAKEGGGVASIGGAGESYFEVQRQMLGLRERKLRTRLEKLEKQRGLLRAQRQRKEIPVVAVVGYTNAGKTSLIRSLTGDTSIVPRDALFATLDVTAHACTLPCRLPILLMDTVGFIARIPTALIAAFNATLRDALDADLILHVQDVSHPDWLNQKETVESTLHNLLGDGQRIVNVANKIDKNEAFQPEESDVVPISATSGKGLDALMQRVEAEVLESTNRLVLTVRVPSGGQEYQWLYRETAVAECEADPSNSQFLVMRIVLTKAAYGRLRHAFPKLQVRRTT